MPKPMKIKKQKIEIVKYRISVYLQKPNGRYIQLKYFSLEIDCRNE